MEDLLVLVNEQDEVLGSGLKLEVHRKKLLHRAFSIFLYDRDTDSLLLQQRAFGKYHSGGKWSNSCCSHPRSGEAYATALARRLKDELTVSIPESESIISNCTDEADSLLAVPDGVSGLIDERITFHYCGRFLYFADYGELAEHEIDRVFFHLFSQNDSITPNPEEIADTAWITRCDIRRQLAADPDYYSAWFPQAFALVDWAIDRYLKE